MLILIKGAGDLASGIAAVLIRANHQVVLTEIAQPTVVRRSVSFAQAVEQGSCRVEEIRGVLAKDAGSARALAAQGVAAVLVDPAAGSLAELKPDVLVDAILAKRNTGLAMGDAPLVVGIGPGFVAGQDCHAVIESQRGPSLGQVIWQGSAIPDSGVPGPVLGVAAERLLRAPADGVFTPLVNIGDIVEEGQPVGRVGDVVMRARISGLVRGMLAPGVQVTKGLKAGDVDPRRDPALCQQISDKALTIGEGVLSAIRTFAEKQQG